MRYAEYVQRLDFLPFSLDEIDKMLNSRPIKRWAYAIHDKDEHEDGTLKEPHIHIEMELNSDQNISTVAEWFHDTENRIQKGKSKNKKYMFENMCSYLIHETDNADGKYKYNAEDVKANFDFVSFMEQVRNGVQESKEKHRHPLADILEMICEDKIPKIKLGDYVSNLDRIKYDKDIRTAYAIRDEKLSREVERNMEVMYFYGPSGTGKTTMAKQTAQEKGYDYFVTGSSNDPLQGYLGQECVILDDIRGSDWKINDLLKLLDNHTNSLAKSRYSNKLMNDCKLMILTSVQSIEQLYENIQQRDNEPITQLKRRCSHLVRFTEEKITFYEYSEGEGEYLQTEEVPNVIKFMKFMSENKSSVNDMISFINRIAKENNVDISKEVEFVQTTLDDVPFE